MKLWSGLLLLVCASCLLAQSENSPEIARAKEGIDRLRELVAAGAAPRAQLERAETALADAEDELSRDAVLALAYAVEAVHADA